MNFAHYAYFYPDAMCVAGHLHTGYPATTEPNEWFVVLHLARSAE